MHWRRLPSLRRPQLGSRWHTAPLCGPTIIQRNVLSPAVYRQLRRRGQAGIEIRGQRLWRLVRQIPRDGAQSLSLSFSCPRQQTPLVDRLQHPVDCQPS